jgi:replication factor C small subunit
MEPPLWTEAHAPALEALPQDDAREYLTNATAEPINLVVHGPPGVGKTAAVRALAREAHENPDNDLIELNVADFFSRSKSEIRSDPRFGQFLEGRSDLSKRDMIQHVLTESASYAPVSGEYKTLLLDNAEAIREDFQQALRRVMEQYHQSTQFVIGTRQPTALIPPLRSRCFPVPMPAPTTDEIADVIADIATKEGVQFDREGVEYVAGYANGDLRDGILAAQTTATQAGEITMNAAYETLGDVGLDDRVEEMLQAAETGNFSDARNELDDLLVEDGLDGHELLTEILSVARSRYDGTRLARMTTLAAEIDADLNAGTSDRVHLSKLLAELGRTSS